MVLAALCSLTIFDAGFFYSLRDRCIDLQCARHWQIPLVKRPLLRPVHPDCQLQRLHQGTACSNASWGSKWIYSSERRISALFLRCFLQLLGTNGILVADGQDWHRQRRKVTAMLSSRAFRDWTSTVIGSEMNTVIALLDTISSEDGEGKLVFTQLLPRFTLSTFAKMALSVGKHAPR